MIYFFADCAWAHQKWAFPSWWFFGYFLRIMEEEEGPSVEPSVPTVEDEFGPPHSQTISESLQLWFLIPAALLAFAAIGQSFSC